MLAWVRRERALKRLVDLQQPVEVEGIVAFAAELRHFDPFGFICRPLRPGR